MSKKRKDVKKQDDEKELKARAYDIISIMQNLQGQLNEVNQALAKIQKEKDKK